MGERRTSRGRRDSRRRGSRFSAPLPAEAPQRDELKKAAEAIKQEYKSLLQHLSHLHGISTSYTDERSLSMFAPNMQLPPELKGLKEQEKTRRQRLKGLRDQLRKRKDSEPVGLADWFESDSGSFLQEPRPAENLQATQEEVPDKGGEKLGDGKRKGRRSEEGERRREEGSRKRMREHGERGRGLWAGSRKRKEHQEHRKREGRHGRERREEGADMAGRRSDRHEHKRRDHRQERKGLGQDSLKRGEGGEICHENREKTGGDDVAGESGAAADEVLAEGGEMDAKDEVAAEVSAGGQDSTGKFDQHLRELKELDSAIASDTMEVWYNSRNGCKDTKLGISRDIAASMVDSEGPSQISTAESDACAASAEVVPGLISHSRKDAEHAIKSARLQLIKLLQEESPDFQPPSYPHTMDIDPEQVPADSAKSKVVIKRKSFFPLPRLKPKEENPDFTIVRPIRVPTIVFNENGSAESIQPRGMGESETQQPLTDNGPEAFGDVPHAPYLPKQQPDNYLDSVPGPFGMHPSSAMLRSPHPLSRSPDGSLPSSNHIGAIQSIVPMSQQSSSLPGRQYVNGDVTMHNPGSAAYMNGYHEPGIGQFSHHSFGGPRVFNNLVPSAPHPYGMRPPAPPPPRPPPRPPSYPFVVRPPPRPPPRMPNMRMGESSFQHAIPGLLNHPVPATQPSACGNFRVPPPPVLDLTAQGPEYEVGKDEEEVLSKSPTSQQTPPPPPPLTSHPLFSLDGHRPLPRTSASHMVHGGSRSVPSGQAMSQDVFPTCHPPPGPQVGGSINPNKSSDEVYLHSKMFHHHSCT